MFLSTLANGRAGNLLGGRTLVCALESARLSALGQSRHSYSAPDERLSAVGPIATILVLGPQRPLSARGRHHAYDLASIKPWSIRTRSAIACSCHRTELRRRQRPHGVSPAAKIKARQR